MKFCFRYVYICICIYKYIHVSVLNQTFKCISYYGMQIKSLRNPKMEHIQNKKYKINDHVILHTNMILSAK